MSEDEVEEQWVRRWRDRGNKGWIEVVREGRFVRLWRWADRWRALAGELEHSPFDAAVWHDTAEEALEAALKTGGAK